MEERNYRKRRRSSAWTVITIVVILFAIGLLLWGGIEPKDRKEMEIKVHSVLQTMSSQETPMPQETPTEIPIPWNLVIVNREHPIPEDWKVEPVELHNGQTVDARIYDPLMEMFEAARSINLDRLPNVESGYRSEEKQQQLYDEKRKEFLQQGYAESDATALTEKWVSVPGTSEHQLGIAVDISGEVYDIYAWLQENSYKYGFILRYTADKTAITGVAPEEWHYRYVGVEAATEIYQQGLCLEEYVDRLRNPHQSERS